MTPEQIQEIKEKALLEINQLFSQEDFVKDFKATVTIANKANAYKRWFNTTPEERKAEGARLARSRKKSKL